MRYILCLDVRRPAGGIAMGKRILMIFFIRSVVPALSIQNIFFCHTDDTYERVNHFDEKNKLDRYSNNARSDEKLLKLVILSMRAFCLSYL